MFDFSSGAKWFGFLKRPKSKQNHSDFRRSNDRLNPCSKVRFSDVSAKIGRFIYKKFFWAVVVGRTKALISQRFSHAQG